MFSTYTDPAPAASTVAKTALRLGLGGILAAHGAQKLFGLFGGGGIEGTAQGMQSMGHRPAKANAILAGALETGSGALLALGLATPAAGAAAAGTMATAADVHWDNGFFAMDGGYEYPAFLALTGAAFAGFGSGAFSLDALTGHVLDRPWMRVAAVASIPVATAVVVTRRRAALKADAAEAPQAQAAESAQA